ncbi:WD40-repeat-containing domain protein [Choanephora cucurbitarum]|nr:WD40-repeat-containing domain protein [Choanephora cucurbitarum]
MSQSDTDIDIDILDDETPAEMELSKDSLFSQTSSISTDQQPLTKETRKLRKKKKANSEDEEFSIKSSRNKQKIKSSKKMNTKNQEKHAPTGNKNSDNHLEQKSDQQDSMDDIDTDDLLERVERLPKIKKTKKKVKRTTSKTQTESPKEKPNVYDPDEIKQLCQKYPDEYWKFNAGSGYGMINQINCEHPLKALPVDISDQGAITGMVLSKDGNLLATFSNVGAIKIWDVQEDFRLLRKIRDTKETQIDEFYCGHILECGLLVAGGKLKDRHRWSAEDNDNHILPCPIKIFDLVTCERVTQLEGHTEEILCIKAVQFRGQNFLVSTSQDGYIMKWCMDKSWTKLLSSTPMADGSTCMAFTVSFVPNTGNKYFMAACDEHLRLYDFENECLLQTFEDMYSSYCDCGKFIDWIDQPAHVDDMEKQVNELSVDDRERKTESNLFAYFISRGAEMCDVSEGVSSKPNTCTLHKLVYPSVIGGQFKLEMVKQFMHEDYHSNSWLVKITSNGRYILAPTIYGQIFVFNIVTGNVSAIIKEHQDIEVRDVIFHPYRPYVFSCGDDGYVKVYSYCT